MKSPVVILGGGGHAKVLVDALLLRKIKILGFVDPISKELRVGKCVVKYLGSDGDFLANRHLRRVSLVNGVGSVGDTTTRTQLFLKFKKKGYRFVSVIHPSAVVAHGVNLEEGVQIMAGAIIQTGSWVGENAIINTKASVDHDCVIGAHVHLAPGVTLSGGVHVGDRSHIGTGVSVRQGVKITKQSLVRMGSVVIKDIQ